MPFSYINSGTRKSWILYEIYFGQHYANFGFKITKYTNSKTSQENFECINGNGDEGED